MGRKALPRNTLVQASLERKNNLGKAAVIESARSKQKHDRGTQKREFRKITEGLNGPLFL